MCIRDRCRWHPLLRTVGWIQHKFTNFIMWLCTIVYKKQTYKNNVKKQQQMELLLLMIFLFFFNVLRARELWTYPNDVSQERCSTGWDVYKRQDFFCKRTLYTFALRTFGRQILKLKRWSLNWNYSSDTINVLTEIKKNLLLLWLRLRVSYVYFIYFLHKLNFF